MRTCTRRFEFDSAHRVLEHKSKCRFLHGHRYVADVTVGIPDLNLLGMVVDFADIKRDIGFWIDENWDHNILLNANDPLWTLGFDRQNGKQPYLFKSLKDGSGINPTAENIATCLFRVVHNFCFTEKWGKGVTAQHVRIYETPNCWADYSLQDYSYECAN